MHKKKILRAMAPMLMLLLALELAKVPAHAAPTAPLAGRVAPPEPGAIVQFAEAGMRDIRAHALTAPERRRVEAALAALPALHRTVLEQRLRHLSFVDGIPGEGTGLTAPVGKTGQFDITLRANLINEPLSTFLTTKERRLFAADGSGRSIVVEASGTDALTYVLLHEATHVVDLGTGITANLDSPFVAGIWQARRLPVPRLARSAAASTPFRGAPKIALGKAETIYDALAQTPFVSLYATTTAEEDFAELVAWNEVLQRHGGRLSITIVDADGHPLRRYEPLNFPAVKARMAGVDQLLQRAAE